MLLANGYFDENLGDYAKTLEIMHGVCVHDHLEDRLFPHNLDEHPRP